MPASGKHNSGQLVWILRSTGGSEQQTNREGLQGDQPSAYPRTPQYLSENHRLPATGYRPASDSWWS